MQNDISLIKENIENLQRDLVVKMNDICSVIGRFQASDDGKMETDQSACVLVPSVPGIKPMTYSAAFAGNLSKTVKSAIAESMRQQKNAERSNATVAVNNMREDGNDVRDGQDLFNFMDYDVRVIRAVRTGRHDKSSSRKARLLKVELQSIFEKNNILQASKFLKYQPSIAKIFELN